MNYFNNHSDININNSYIKRVASLLLLFIIIDIRSHCKKSSNNDNRRGYNIFN